MIYEGREVRNIETYQILCNDHGWVKPNHKCSNFELKFKIIHIVFCYCLQEPAKKFPDCLTYIFGRDDYKSLEAEVEEYVSKGFKIKSWDHFYEGYAL